MNFMPYLGLVVFFFFLYVFLKSYQKSPAYSMGNTRHAQNKEGIPSFREMWRSMRKSKAKNKADKLVAKEMISVEQALLAEKANEAEIAADQEELVELHSQIESMTVNKEQKEFAGMQELMVGLQRIAQEMSQVTQEPLFLPPVQEAATLLHAHTKELGSDEMRRISLYDAGEKHIKPFVEGTGHAVDRAYRAQGKIGDMKKSLKRIKKNVLKPVLRKLKAAKVSLEYAIVMLEAHKTDAFAKAVEERKKELALVSAQSEKLHMLLANLEKQRDIILNGFRALRGDTEQLLKLKAQQKTYETSMNKHIETMQKQLASLKVVPVMTETDLFKVLPFLMGKTTAFFQEFGGLYELSKLFLANKVLPFLGTSALILETTRTFGQHEYFVEKATEDLATQLSTIETIAKQIGENGKVDAFPKELDADANKIAYLEKIGYKINEHIEASLTENKEVQRLITEHVNRLTTEIQNITQIKSTVSQQLGHMDILLSRFRQGKVISGIQIGNAAKSQAQTNMGPGI